MAVEIRRREPADLPGCVDLLRQSFEHDAYPTRWPVEPELFLTPENLAGAWVACDAQKPQAVLGHMVLVPASGGLEVSRLFTSRAHRGAGLGAALLNTALEHARAAGVELSLQVVEGTTAVGFYEAQGWRYQQTVDAYWVLADGTIPRMRCYAAPLR